MPVASAKKIVALSQADNPRLALIKSIGDLTEESVLYDLVLVGTYIQPETSKGGIILLDRAKEDEYQGVVGLILKMGPEAEKIAADTNGPVTGDWVVSSIKDGWGMTIRETPCRLVPYEKLRMRISDPKVIYDA